MVASSLMRGTVEQTIRSSRAVGSPCRISIGLRSPSDALIQACSKSGQHLAGDENQPRRDCTIGGLGGHRSALSESLPRYRAGDLHLQSRPRSSYTVMARPGSGRKTSSSVLSVPPR